MNLKTFTIWMKQDCFFGHYQQNPSLLREKSVSGAKCPKEDLQCGNMVGGMERPLMTGKAAKPRCSKNQKINNLPVI
jgi:hypothetical protein